MQIDADPAASGIQTALSVTGDQPFRIGIDVTKVGPSSYIGYQWTVEFRRSELAFVSYTENSGDTGLALCVNSVDVHDDPQLVDRAGGCLTSDPNVLSRFIGETTRMELRCLGSGRFAVRLVPTSENAAFGASLLAWGGDNLDLPTTTTGITVDCGSGGGETATPDARATNTSVPTATATPNPCTGAVSSPPSDADCQYAMRLDADPAAGGIQTALSVTGDQPFRIGIDVTKVGLSSYVGYQWTVEFRKSELAFVSYTENSGDTGLALCVSSVDVSRDPQLVDRAGGCLASDPNVFSRFIGETTRMELRCLQSGRFAIRLVPTSENHAFGGSLISEFSTLLPTTTTDITVDCGGGAETATAEARPTDTAVPTATAIATSTPTATATASATATATQAPAPCADVNGDGRVTRVDALLVATHLLGRYQARYDVNRDGHVNVDDVLTVLQQLGRRC